MKRYIYISIGVIIMIVLLAFYGIINNKDTSDDAPMPYNDATSPVTASTAPATVDATTNPTEGVEATVAPSVPSDTNAPSNPDTPPLAPDQPGQTTDKPPIMNASELRKNPDGSIYFVDSVTGEKQGSTDIDPSISNDTPIHEQIGEGSEVDKTNVANAYIVHANALYDGNWALACKYMQIPTGMDNSTCEAKLAKRTASTPMKSKITLDVVSGNIIIGDIATIAPNSAKYADGQALGGATTMHRTPDPLVWLVDGKQLTDIA